MVAIFKNILLEGRIVVLLDECNATLNGGAMALTDKRFERNI